MTRRVLVVAAACVALLAACSEAVAQTESLAVICGGRTIGHLTATTFGNRIDESFSITGARAESDPRDAPPVHALTGG